MKVGEEGEGRREQVSGREIQHEYERARNESGRRG